jgi:hypothetical protein
MRTDKLILRLDFRDEIRASDCRLRVSNLSEYRQFIGNWSEYR